MRGTDSLMRVMGNSIRGSGSRCFCFFVAPRGCDAYFRFFYLFPATLLFLPTASYCDCCWALWLFMKSALFT